MTPIQKKIVEFLQKNDKYDYQISDIAKAINVQYFQVKKEIITLIKDQTLVKTRTINPLSNLYQTFSWFTTDRQIEAKKVADLSARNVKRRRENRLKENGFKNPQTNDNMGKMFEEEYID